VRALVFAIDRLLRRAHGVYEFTGDPEGLLRLQITHAPRTLHLPGLEVSKGDPVLGLHLWNEQVPPIPPNGPDLAWGLALQRRFVRSLRAVAAEMQRDPRLAVVRAVGASTGVLVPGDASSGVRAFQRLGFAVTPYLPPLGRFGAFWENFYSWWLMWAFNPTSLRHRRFSQMGRTEVWMSADAFLSRYGGAAVPPLPPHSSTHVPLP
jgi:hypothetical protein